MRPVSYDEHADMGFDMLGRVFTHYGNHWWVLVQLPHQVREIKQQTLTPHTLSPPLGGTKLFVLPASTSRLLCALYGHQV